MIRSRSLFCHEWPDRNAHDHSFVKSNKSDLLMVAVFKEQREQIAHMRSIIWAILSERAKSRSLFLYLAYSTLLSSYPALPMFACVPFLCRLLWSPLTSSTKTLPLLFVAQCQLQEVYHKPTAPGTKTA